MPRRHIRRNKQQPEPVQGNGRTVMLTTAPAVIEKLGGLAPLAKLTSKAAKRTVKTQNVWNWRDKGRFPPAYFLIHRRELRRLGFDAPSLLWRVLPLPAGVSE